MKLLYVIVFNAFVVWMLHLGLVEHVEMCWWIFVGLEVLVGLMLSFGWSDKLMEAVRQDMNPKALEYKAIIRPISFAVDTAVIVALTMFGHYLMAVWVLYTVACHVHVWQELDRPR